MPRRIAHLSLLVADYDEGPRFFTAIGFSCLQDSDLGGGKRWLTVAPPGGGTAILLARAEGEAQRSAVGRQGGGRVWLFLETDDFDADLTRLRVAGATIEEAPRDEPYGRVVVWSDPWGNRWDLIQPAG